MRIRRKKWAQKELEESKFYIDQPAEFKGKWSEKFKKKQPLHIELGCGKGIFCAKVIGNVHLANKIKVGAGAVVVSSFLEEGITIAGVPARKIEKRK